MKIRYENGVEQQHPGKPVKEIKLGTVFSGDAYGYKNGVFMKVYDRIVEMGWGDTLHLPEDDLHGQGDSFGIRYIYNYRELDVELLVKGEK